MCGQTGQIPKDTIFIVLSVAVDHAVNKLYQMLPWWTKIASHSIGVWDIVTDMAGLFSLYPA